MIKLFLFTMLLAISYGVSAQRKVEVIENPAGKRFVKATVK